MGRKRTLPRIGCPYVPRHYRAIGRAGGKASRQHRTRRGVRGSGMGRQIDCMLRLPGGSVVGEMVPMSELTENRIRAAGKRLRQRAEGRNVQLVNELRPPIRIVSLGD